MALAAISSTAVTSRRAVAGFALALIAATIWALWIVATRQAVLAQLPVVWLGLLRFAVPAIALAPFWWRGGLLPAGVDGRLILLMVAGAGAPFFLIVATGMRYAAAGEVGILLVGTMPFFVVAISSLIDRERFGRPRLAGFALILGALLLIGGLPVVSGQGMGRLLAPLGAAMWAAYTLAFRRTGINPVAAAGLIATWSTLLLAPLAILEGIEPLIDAGPEVLAAQVVAQGILSGIVALVAYGAAVARIGPSRAAVVTSTAPALAIILAVPLLGEMPTAAALVGVALALAGVALASGALGAGEGRTSRPSPA